MPTALQLALEASLSAVWTALYKAEVLADETGRESVREDITAMRYHVMAIQQQMVDERSKRLAFKPRVVGVDLGRPTVRMPDLPF